SFMIVNCSAFSDYIFQLAPSRGDTLYTLRDSVSITMIGGRGAPVMYRLNVSHKHKPVSFTADGYMSTQGNVVLRIDSITGDSVLHTTRLAAKNEKKRSELFSPSDGNSQTPWMLAMLPVLGIAALLMFVIYWLRRRSNEAAPIAFN
ncbi:MAG: hypothetical protein ACRC3B_22465, partial [Bacteroidia bacterium]